MAANCLGFGSDWLGVAATDEVSWLPTAWVYGLRLAGPFQTFDWTWSNKVTWLHTMMVIHSQQHITHWSHIKIMEWFSSNRGGVIMDANYLGFGSDWLGVAATDEV
jgi:hypothetical protein